MVTPKQPDAIEQRRDHDESPLAVGQANTAQTAHAAPSAAVPDEHGEEQRVEDDDVDALHGSDSGRRLQLGERPQHERREREEDPADDPGAEPQQGDEPKQHGEQYRGPRPPRGR